MTKTGTTKYHQRVPRPTMPNPVYRTALFLSQLVAKLPIGTNLALAHLIFTLLAGHLLQSRGALFPALAATGLTDSQVRAAQAALREGKWTLTYLLKILNWLLHKEAKAIAHHINGWHPMPIDWVGFYRPRLKECKTKHFHSQSQRALPAIELGMVAKLKKVGNRLIACLVMRCPPKTGPVTELVSRENAASVGTLSRCVTAFSRPRLWNRRGKEPSRGSRSSP